MPTSRKSLRGGHHTANTAHAVRTSHSRADSNTSVGSLDFAEAETWKDSDSGSDSNENDVDAPRVAQWMDDDELHGSETGIQRGRLSSTQSVQDELSSLPFGLLREAQRSLVSIKIRPEKSPLRDSDAPDKGHVNTKGKEVQERQPKGVEKRPHKHAPIEVTSKRPVSRMRTVVNVKNPTSRDPRFLPLAGEFSEEKFRKAYEFLTESHQVELVTLREDLKRARKRLPSSSLDEYEARANEVAKLELALKRAESMVNKDRRDKIERESLAGVKKAEQERRKQGKKEWHLKKAKQREIVMQARYEALASEGGNRVVRKAIEKRQKKIFQKEKRARPEEQLENGTRVKRRRT